MNCSRYLFIRLLAKYSFWVREITRDIVTWENWYCLRDCFERPNGCRDLSVWEQEEDARGNETDFSDT